MLLLLWSGDGQVLASGAGEEVTCSSPSLACPGVDGGSSGASDEVAGDFDSLSLFLAGQPVLTSTESGELLSQFSLACLI